MNNIEDIKLLRKMKNDYLNGFEYYTDPKAREKAEAIEYILSDYEKLQEEFKQVDHECDRLEKIDFEKDMKIKELQKENEKLKYKYNKALSDVIAGVDLDNTYISKQKVKDKIEELNRKIDKSIDNSKGGLDEEFIEKAGKLLTQKRILQELLGSEE